MQKQHLPRRIRLEALKIGRNFMNTQTTDLQALKPYPEDQIVRDQYGMWFHPDYLKYWDENFGEGTELCSGDEWEKLLVDLNIDTFTVSLDADDPKLSESADVKNGDMSAWVPNKPDEPGDWFLLLITDSEDGPQAWFAKSKEEFVFADAHIDKIPKEVAAAAGNEDLLFIDAHATSSEVLSQFLINSLDNAVGDVWESRTIAFIEMWTRVLVYLRDSGFIKLAPNELAQYVGLEDLEELVFNHQGKYGQDFERVAEQLQGYILSLPCYSTDPIDFKKQKDITREQHGFITMQLTKFIDDLTFSYGHILGKAEAEATATETTSLREYILMHHYDIGDRSVHFSGEGLTIQEVKDLAVYIQFKAENLLSDTVSLSNITIAQFLETHGAKILKENVLSLIGFNPLGMILIDMYEERESRICGNNWYAENYEAFDSKYGEAASTFLKAKSEGKNLDGALI